MNVSVLDIDSLHLKLTREFAFTATNPNYSGNEEHDFFFIKRWESIFNDKLVAQGHLFLNEVLRELGIPLIQSGQVMGWVHSDGLIDIVELNVGYDAMSGMWIQMNPDRIILDQLLN